MNKIYIQTLIAISVVSLLLTSGCYTKFYRPGMDDRGPYSTEQLYNRDDSTAIDTTLTREDWDPDTYPPTYYDHGWSYWGRPRGYTRWGFDFDHFDPGYYRSYYGYYDYYGTPWWHHRWHDPWWYHHGHPGHGGATEPPSERPGRRGRDAVGGGSTVNPPTTVPSTAVPAPQPQPQPKDTNTTKNPQQDDPNKRGGRR